jgi:hypothetical protein
MITLWEATPEEREHQELLALAARRHQELLTVAVMAAILEAGDRAQLGLAVPGLGGGVRSQKDYVGRARVLLSAAAETRSVNAG